jgi:hypothetical protein
MLRQNEFEVEEGENADAGLVNLLAPSDFAQFKCNCTIIGWVFKLDQMPKMQ